MDLDGVAEATDGYSGADIKLLSKEAAMRPVRRLLVKLDEMESGMGLEGGDVVGGEEVQRLILENPITQKDLDDSVECTNKSSGGGLWRPSTRVGLKSLDPVENGNYYCNALFSFH